MQLDLSYHHDFLKPEFRNTKFRATMPREFLLESHSDLLRVIQRFFTCEGRFNRVYQYHIRILMHFTGKKPLNLPYYLFISLGRMDDRVQLRKEQGDASLFHFSLIKLLVLEELRKRNRDWESFLNSSSIAVDSLGIPQSLRNAPSSVERTATSIPESFVKKREKETEDPVASQQAKKKGKKLQFSPEVTEAPRKPLTKSATKRMHVIHTSQEISETPETFIQPTLSDDRDTSIIELQEQLKKAHFVIAQLQHENRELKKKSLEEYFRKDTSVIGERSTLSTPTGSKTRSKGKAVEQTPEVEEIPKPSVPLTRSSTRKLQHQEEIPAQNQPAEKKDDEGKHTFKRLNKQLREAQNVIFQLREGDREFKMKFAEHLRDYGPAIDKVASMVRRTLPLHRQLKSFYQHNLILRKENKTLKQSLQQVEIGKKGKLDLLAEAAEN
jgi:hypothetical protein